MAAGVDLTEQPLSDHSAGARGDAGTSAFGGSDRPPGHPPNASGRSIGPWAFTAFAVCSFGGPLALAALDAPGLVADASDSAGLAMLAAFVVFTAPVAIWLRYSRHIGSSGGLYAFVEAAAGRRMALAQAAIWIFSYALYLVYTTVQIVYDMLPSVLPGEHSYQTLLALAIPVALAAVMIAGRSATLLVLGLVAVGQLALAGILDAVTIAHVTFPASTFTAGAPTGSLGKASAQTSLLYICGGLPLFLGGELATPSQTIRRGLGGAFLLTGLVVMLAVAPLAAEPGLLQTDMPGFRLAQEFSSAGFADAIAIGVAVSTAALILCEYVALTRLVHAITAWRVRPVTVAIGAAMVLAAPFSLIDPEGFYNTLSQPSLIALWLSQLIVFAVYPLFAYRHRQRAPAAWVLAGVASGLALYGLWTALQQASS